MTRFYKLALYVVGIFLIVIVCILLCLNNSSDMKYVEATSVHDAYFIYKSCRSFCPRMPQTFGCRMKAVSAMRAGKFHALFLKLTSVDLSMSDQI